MLGWSTGPGWTRAERDGMAGNGLGDLRAYDPARDRPAPRSVALTAIVLAKDEEVNIARCLRSLEWCDQRIVVDSESKDRTVPIAKDEGAAVLVQPWLGFPGQRNFALAHGAVRHPWVYFVDADEWVSPELAGEIARAIEAAGCAAYAHRLRLVFLGRWIRHCGWYSNSWVVRLCRREAGTYGSEAAVGERLAVRGPVGRLRHDIVDEDAKGLAAWLHKHIDYARAEADRRLGRPPLRRRRLGESSASLGRMVAKEIIFPVLPCRPLTLFAYMYLIRGGWLDGWQGLTFCLLHGWHEAVVAAFVRAERHRRAESGHVGHSH